VLDSWWIPILSVPTKNAFVVTDSLSLAHGKTFAKNAFVMTDSLNLAHGKTFLN